MKLNLGNFYRHLAIFIWSHWTYLLQHGDEEAQVVVFMTVFEGQCQNLFDNWADTSLYLLVPKSSTTYVKIKQQLWVSQLNIRAVYVYKQCLNGTIKFNPHQKQ